MDVVSKGRNENRQAFVQYYGSESLDAANLMMALTCFMAPTELVADAIITFTSSRRSNHRVLIDPSGATIQQYGAGRAYLVRPDGYIGFWSSIADAGVLLPRHLARVLDGARTPTVPVNPAFAVDAVSRARPAS
jgi:hypothetical protein